MTNWRTLIVSSALFFLPTACSPTPPRPVVLNDAPAPATPDDSAKTFDWKSEIADVIGTPGSLHPTDPVYTITIPRSDVIFSVDAMSVPTSAGIASTFHFYLCPCGKMNVIGEFVAIDYEANDVIDSLRPRNLIRIAGITPLAIGSKPNLLSIRFQGEGNAKELAGLIKEALRWTGEARMKPVK